MLGRRKGAEQRRSEVVTGIKPTELLRGGFRAGVSRGCDFRGLSTSGWVVLLSGSPRRAGGLRSTGVHADRGSTVAGLAAWLLADAGGRVCHGAVSVYRRGREGCLVPRSPRALTVLLRRLLAKTTSASAEPEENPSKSEPPSPRLDGLSGSEHPNTAEAPVFQPPADLPTSTTSATTSAAGPSSAAQHATSSVPDAVTVPPARPSTRSAGAPKPPPSLPASPPTAAASDRSDPASAASGELLSERRGDLARVRAWARANGYTVADRGRIAAAVLTAYDRAH